MSKRKMTATKEELKEMYVNKGMTTVEIAEKYECTRSIVARWLKKYDIKARKPKGKNHGMWKGGKIEKGDGRVGIWKPSHPRADQQGYVYEHTLVVEDKLGKLPKENEQIHHINLDKKDNRPENLVLCKNSSEHAKLHRSIENLIPKLLKEDVIEFDKDEMKYVLVD